MPDEKERARIRKQNIARMLLEELKTGERRWWYISVADDSYFHGGFLIHAFGPTDAWRIFHALGFYPMNSSCTTSTSGPLDPVAVEKIPDDQKWRRLSKEEVDNLGK